MQIKKVGKIVLGAELTNEERKAMDIEIQKELAEYDRKNAIEIDAIFLWALHEQLGFGVERLKKFFFNFAPELDKLLERYELKTGDAVWLCTYKLKDIGADIEAWEQEINKEDLK